MTSLNSRSNHERSHSDTHAVPVDLSAESSSVTSLSKLHKSHTSGMLLLPLGHAPSPLGINSIPFDYDSPSPCFLHTASNSITNSPATTTVTTLNTTTITVPTSTIVASTVITSTTTSTVATVSATTTTNTTTASTSNVPLKLSFVHAAACSSLISSVRKLSSSGNNRLVGRSLSKSSYSNASTSGKHVKTNPLSKENKHHMKAHQDCSIINDKQNRLQHNSQSVCVQNQTFTLRKKKRTKLKFTKSHCDFSQSLPTPKTSPSRSSSEIKFDFESIVSDKFFEKNGNEFRTSTPVHGRPKQNSKPSIERNIKDTFVSEMYTNSYSNRTKCPLKPGKSLGTVNVINTEFATENVDPNYKRDLCDSSRRVSLSSPKKYSAKNILGQRVADGHGISLIHRIFRSKSEDAIDTDKVFSPKIPREEGKKSSYEVSVSSIFSPSAFRRSHSEDFLNKMFDDSGVKKYAVQEKSCNRGEKAKRPRITRPLRTFLSPNSESVGTAFKMRLRKSKSHYYFRDDDEVYLPSQFFLESNPSCMDSSQEITEQKYHTLPRNLGDKETYFPSSVTKTKRNSRKSDSNRVYQVNKVNQPDAHEPRCTCDGNSAVNGDHINRIHNTFIKDCSDGECWHPIFNSPATSEKSPWFEKYVRTRKSDVKDVSSEKCSESPFTDSFDSTLFSIPSDDLIPSVVLNHSASSSIEESVQFLSLCNSGGRDVRRRVAEKLRAVIKELEDEMLQNDPDDPNSDIIMENQGHLPDMNPLVSINITVPRPSTLQLQKRLYRRNSAPMLSPIEEVKTSPDGDRPLEPEFTIYKSPKKIGGMHRSNSAPTYSPMKEKFNLEKPSSCDGGFDVGTCIETHSSNDSLMTSPYYKNVFNLEDQNLHSHLRDFEISETYTLHTPSLVNPLPTTYCDQYGFECDVDYV